MTFGGLPPRRPDQVEESTPRLPVPGARLPRLAGTPMSRAQLSIGPQVATTFYTFPNPGRLFTAGLSFAAGTNASYAASVTQLYARVVTASGLVLCSVQLALSAPSQNANGDDRFIAPPVGVPVAAGDKIQLDVNNNVGITGGNGLMRADCEVFFSIP